MSQAAPDALTAANQNVVGFNFLFVDRALRVTNPFKEGVIMDRKKLSKKLSLEYELNRLRSKIPSKSDELRSVQARLHRTGGSFSINMASASVDEVYEYAQREAEKADVNLDKLWPDFERNYKAIQNKLTKALDIPRNEMPVIEPNEIQVFKEDLEEGKVDLFRPWARGTFEPPGWTSQGEAEEWIDLGFEDGKLKDDQIKAKRQSISSGDLLPTQSQIWFDKIVGWLIKFGPPQDDFGETIIVSKDGYILDGHHRWASAHMADPSITLDALHVPLGIQKLLEISRTYGAAMGNKPKH